MHLSYYIASKSVSTKFFSLNAIRINYIHINYRIKDEELGRSYWREVKVEELRGVDRVTTGDCIKKWKSHEKFAKR